MHRFVCAAALAALAFAARLQAAAPVFSNNFSAVTLDGVRLGTDTDPSNYSMFPTVVYDPGSGLFHMWVAATNALNLEGLRHATSSDGVHFISDGNLSFAGGSPFPIYGAATEPQFEFPRAARIGGDWKLLIWTENGAPGLYGDYNYNESINDVGTDPATLAVAHQGPVYPTNGAGTFGQTTGPFGIVDGKLYVADDRPGGISKWDLDDTTPPSVATPADMSQDLITGTGYVYFLTHPGDPLGVYVHNVGRVLDQGDDTLGVYYSLRHPDGTRVNRQIYYAQSGDGGQTWSAPAGVFAWGDAVRVDGSETFEFFSHPEATLVGARRVLYFSTKTADGAFVVATSAAQAASPGSWSLLFGNGQLYGESGNAVVRTAGGGYAVAGVSGSGAFSLIQLDETGDVQWQRSYASPGINGYVSGLAQAADGGFVVAGTTPASCSAAWVVKTDPLGNVVWANSYATDNGLGVGDCVNQVSDMVQTEDGSLAIAGRVAGSFGLIQLSASGSLQRILAYPDGMHDSAASTLVETPDGGFGIAGYPSSGYANHHFYWAIRTDATGTPLWYGLRGGGQGDAPSGIANRPGGGLIVTGSSGSYGGAWTLAYDQDGNLDWEKVFTLPGYLAASRIVPSGAGTYGIAARNGPDPGRATLFEATDAGLPEWGRRFAAQTSSASSFRAVVPTLDGGLLAVGGDAPTPIESRLLAVKVDAGGGFVGCLDEEQSVSIGVSDTSGSGTTGIAFGTVDEASHTTVAALTVTSTATDVPTRIVCRATLPAELSPAALSADLSGNGVADPGEEFVTAPAWTNQSLVGTLLSGHTSVVSDTNGLDTTDPDLDASYGAVGSHATADCATATGDCYLFRFQNITRPSQHWDAYFDETLTTSDPHHRYAKRWTVHAGLSFTDVSPSSGYYPFIEDIFHNRITGGCGVGIYCPTSSVTRAQMAVFLLKSKHGASFAPPSCSGHFPDVPCPGQYTDWIEQLYAEGITAGCGSGNYCPNEAVTRQQMAVFLLKARNGSGYVPVSCSGIFADVPCPSQYADWIETLFLDGITVGCGANPQLDCPSNANTRQQMAVFLVKTFSLKLYGP
jgi:S-layer homology domain